MVRWFWSIAILSCLGAGCGQSERDGEPGGKGQTGSASSGSGSAGGNGATGATGGASGGGGAGASGGEGGSVNASGGSAGSTPVLEECEASASDAPLDCELDGCTTKLDVSITCTDVGDQDQMRLALTEEAALYYVPVHNDGRLFEVTEAGATHDTSFPFRFTPMRLAAAHSGELFAYGFLEGEYQLGAGAVGSWELTVTPMLLEETSLYASSSGEPMLFGRLGNDYVLHSEGGITDASFIPEPSFFALDGSGAPIVVGYQPLYTDDDQLYASRGAGALALTEDPLRGKVVPAPLPPLAASTTVQPELALVRSTPEALLVGWLEGDTYTEAPLEGTATAVTECPSSSYGACQPDCELTGTAIQHLTAVRDVRGNVYVAFVHQTIDRTISGGFDSAIGFCNYNPSRDDTSSELRVLRLENRGESATAVVTLPDVNVFSLRLASYEDDIALAFMVTGPTFRVVRLGMSN